jgi:MerR family transcriptional regulator, light-induced transcriptional regulator
MIGTLAEYLAAVRTGDRKRALEVVIDAQRNGADLTQLYLDVFQPALRKIGELWECNEVSVAEEHLATAITQSIMARLYTEATLPGESGRHLVAACAEYERHEVGLRMLCDFLDLEGWTTTFLGASVPTASLARMICERKPDVLAMSASLAPHVTQLRHTIRAVREACGDTPPIVLVGGRVFHETPELAYAIGADLTARDAREAVDKLKEHFAV